MGATGIQWTDHSINPIRARNKETGQVGHFCEKISPGCGHCYSSEWNEHRLGTKLAFLPVNRDKVELFLDVSKLHEVIRRRKPTKFFWCDMTDLFLEHHPVGWIDQCFAAMYASPQHTHQVLTKRPERMAEYLNHHNRPGLIQAFAANLFPDRESYLDWVMAHPMEWPLPNVWCMISVENQEYADRRTNELLKVPARVRGLSVEPLLGLVDLDLDEIAIALEPGSYGPNENILGPIHWVIIGGESGPHARPCQVEWVRDLLWQCQAAGVACFVKQLGSRPVCEHMRDGVDQSAISRILGSTARCVTCGFQLPKHSKGGNPSEWPEDLRVRQFPETTHA